MKARKARNVDVPPLALWEERFAIVSGPEMFFWKETPPPKKRPIEAEDVPDLLGRAVPRGGRGAAEPADVDHLLGEVERHEGLALLRVGHGAGRERDVAGRRVARADGQAHGGPVEGGAALHDVVDRRDRRAVDRQEHVAGQDARVGRRAPAVGEVASARVDRRRAALGPARERDVGEERGDCGEPVGARLDGDALAVAQDLEPRQARAEGELGRMRERLAVHGDDHVARVQARARRRAVAPHREDAAPVDEVDAELPRPGLGGRLARPRERDGERGGPAALGQEQVHRLAADRQRVEEHGRGLGPAVDGAPCDHRALARPDHELRGHAVVERQRGDRRQLRLLQADRVVVLRREEDRAPHAVVQDVHGGGLALRDERDALLEVEERAHGAPVEALDAVAGREARLPRRAAGNHLADLGRRLLEPRGVRDAEEDDRHDRVHEDAAR